MGSMGSYKSRIDITLLLPLKSSEFTNTDEQIKAFIEARKERLGFKCFGKSVFTRNLKPDSEIIGYVIEDEDGDNREEFFDSPVRYSDFDEDEYFDDEYDDDYGNIIQFYLTNTDLEDFRNVDLKLLENERYLLTDGDNAIVKLCVANISNSIYCDQDNSDSYSFRLSDLSKDIEKYDPLITLSGKANGYC